MLRGKNRMWRYIILGCLFSAGFMGTLFAAENGGSQDKIIGQTFKALARAYVVTVDMAQLKDQSVKRIESMKESRFRIKYAEVYKVARELPSKIRSKDGITSEMTKSRAIRVVRSLDKKMLYEMINNIPDTVIAREYHERSARKSGEPTSGDLFSRISRAWGELVLKMNKNTVSGK